MRARLGPGALGRALDWAGLHSLGHTCASLLIDEGRSPVQIGAWLGEGLHLAPPVGAGVGSLAASLAAASLPFGAGLGETPA